MLSDDLPAVGALLSDNNELDVERQPWHFESDDTLVIPPEPGSRTRARCRCSSPNRCALAEPRQPRTP